LVLALMSLNLGLSAPHEATECPISFASQGEGLIQLKAIEHNGHPGITPEELVDAEAHFAHTGGEADHGDVGGDRMSEMRHNYAPTYAKFLSRLLRGATPTANPKIAEVGILTGTGLGMWSRLFPQSDVFGFDLNTTSFLSNRGHLTTLGMQDARVLVQTMNQMEDNIELLQWAFGKDTRLSIVVDDGYHIPEAGEKTFTSFRPFLEDRFVYFIEDLTKNSIEEGKWEIVKKHIMSTCEDCAFVIECPPTSDKDECMAVISRL